MTDSTLSMPDLDAAVAAALGRETAWRSDGIALRDLANGPTAWIANFQPSSNWAHGGPIIERHGIALDCWPGRETEYRWRAAISATTVSACEYGPTALIAAMRAFVATHPGEDRHHD